MSKISAIALNTFRESIRSKVLYAVLFFSLLLVLLSTFFGTVTIGDQVKVIKDFGLFTISIFSVAYVVIAGSSLLHKELARKTIYNILGKAVRRSEFIAGKYLGMLATAICLIFLMTPSLMAYLYLFEGRLDPAIAWSAVYLIFELTIICAAAIFFSTIVVTPVLSGLFTFGIFLAGRSVPYLDVLLAQGVSGAAGNVLRALRTLLPNLDKMNLANQVVNLGISAIELEKLVWAGIYAVSYAAVLLILSTFIFQRREFN